MASVVLHVPLLRMLVPFALGIAAVDGWPVAPAPLTDAVVCMAVAAAALGLCARRLPSASIRVTRDVAECLLGASLGALALSLRLFAPQPLAEPTVALRVLSAPIRSGDLCTLDVWIAGSRPGRSELRARGEPCDWLPGQLGLARLRLTRPDSPSNPGGSDPRQRAARRGVFVRASVIDDSIVATGMPPYTPLAILERLRRALGAALDPPEEPHRAGALLRALVTGERGGLAPEVVAAFAGSGTAHILAVSGLNVSLVFLVTQSCVQWALRRSRRLRVLRRARSAAVGAGLGVAALYSAVAGFGVPALRAAAMAFAATVALLGGRPAARWNALAAAALFVLALDPSSLFSASLLLSFSAVAGLLLWDPPLQGVAGTLECTIAASLATAPWLAVFGLPLPAGGPIANLVAVPGFNALVPLALVTAILGALCEPAGAVLRPVARAIADLGIGFLEAMSSPDLLQGLEQPVTTSLALASLGFAARWAWQRSWTRARVAACVGMLSVVAGLVLPPSAPQGSGLLFLSVGHGDATLLYSGGNAWLIDAGPRSAQSNAGDRIVRPALRAEGVRRLDVLVVTHSDLDHLGGAASVVRGVPVGELWLSPETADHPAARDLLRAAAERDVPLRLVHAGLTRRVGALQVDVLWPPRDATGSTRTSNDGSLVLRVTGYERCALLPGDISARVELELLATVGRCELLKLAHHGSRSSSDSHWLDRLDPAVAVASHGTRPRAPLPHAEVRARLEQRAIALHGTERGGAIRARFTEHGLAIAPFRTD